jgi:predicted O-methyltransferase YrrM
MVAQTGHRREGFEFMLEHLRQCRQPRIVETGCAPSEGNFTGDGCSTLLFDAIAEELDGSVFSVDINPDAVAVARRQVGPRTTVHCGDSVTWLGGARRQVDLLYLDSYDFEPMNPWPSMAHHMQELAAGFHLLKPGSLVAVDDNYQSPFGLIGKGGVVAEYFERVGIPLVFEGYQCIWRIPLRA